MAVTRNGNSVEFLLDGEAFFRKLRALFLHIQHQPTHPLTYVRLAYWSANKDCSIGATGQARNNLLVELARTAQAGHPVDIILWGPGQAERRGTAGPVYTTNTELKRTAENITKQELRLAIGLGDIRVYLEPYGGGIGTSQHQKIAIFSDQGQRTVLLGGFNLSNEYNALELHTPIETNFWHDTAIALRGLATDDVEAEWMRRWRKSELPIHNNPTAQVPQPAVGGHQVRVTIATTNNEGDAPVRDIRATIVNHINAAQNYVYLENYGVTDPAIVNALVARRAAVPALQVILVCPYSLSSGAEEDVGVFRYLMRITWVKLAMVRCFAFTVRDRGIVLRSQCQSISLSLREDDPWHADNEVVVKSTALGDFSAKLTDVTSISNDFEIYAPVRARRRPSTTRTPGDLTQLYVHSKLALIDDQVLAVGSANWTFRSMDYDGEIMAFVEHPLALDVRRRLFSHYNRRVEMTPASWVAVAAENERRVTNNTMADGEKMIVPIPPTNYMTTLPSGIVGYSGYHWF